MVNVTGRVTRIEWLTGGGCDKANIDYGTIWRTRIHNPANLFFRANLPYRRRCRGGDVDLRDLSALGDVEGCCDGGNSKGDGREKDGEELHGSREYRSERRW